MAQCRAALGALGVCDTSRWVGASEPAGLGVAAGGVLGEAFLTARKAVPAEIGVAAPQDPQNLPLPLTSLPQ